jgi:hypothetical protein
MSANQVLSTCNRRLWCLIVSIRQGSDYTQADPNCLVLGAPTDSAGLTDFTHFSKYYEN